MLIRSSLTAQINAGSRGASVSVAQTQAETALALSKTGASLDEIAAAAQNAGEQAEKRTNYRWENYLERNEGRILQFNIVLSLISFPEPNVFSCNLTVDKDCRAEILVAEGNYRPDMSAMPTERWRQISTVNLIAGSNQMCIDIPYDQQNLFAYPTNFKKKIGDEYFNAYHFVHIVDLAEIYAFSGRGMFRDFAMKWLRYYEQWEHVSALAEMDYSLLPHKYGINFREMIETKISSTISC